MTPIAVQRSDAAALLGVSTSTFDDYVRRGVLPKPRRLTDRGAPLWSYRELVEAFESLPRDGETGDVASMADAPIGLIQKTFANGHSLEELLGAIAGLQGSSDRDGWVVGADGAVLREVECICTVPDLSIDLGGEDQPSATVMGLPVYHSRSITGWRIVKR